AQASGAAGVVIDGWVRDLPLLQDVALPLLARGVMPARADGDDTGRTGVPVKIGGLDIAPGDVIVVDANGLVVMPAGRIGAAYEELEKLLKERTCR
ncbi:MAG TPA: hypothetical protein VF171_04345, partial [Trueperaceae bacterium]